MSFQYDPTTANGRSRADFALALATLRAELSLDPNARSFVADNTSYDCSSRSTCHVVTTKNMPNGLRNGYLRWLSALVSGTDWNDVTLAP